MKRINLTDGSGWFDMDAAQEYEEDTRFDFDGPISVPTESLWDHEAKYRTVGGVPTGSLWYHEALYRTVGGAWVLAAWSQGSGPDTYEVIEDAEAARWLLQNEHELPAELLEYAKQSEV